MLRFEEAESALNKADRCSRERNSSSVIDPSAMLRTDNTIATALGRLYFCQKKSQQALTCFEQASCTRRFEFMSQKIHIGALCMRKIPYAVTSADIEFSRGSGNLPLSDFFLFCDFFPC